MSSRPLRWLAVVVAAALALAAGIYFGQRHLGGDGAGRDGAPLLAIALPDTDGKEQPLGQWKGKVLVVNFWATWCTPCREEMPGFVKLQSRWQGRGVQFVGLAQDEPAKVAAFGRDLAINYPLWIGGADVMDLSRRLGNRLGVLPHTVLLDDQGRVLESRIGMYSEADLDSRLAVITGK